ncbi:MAG: hypothetical protein IPO67_27825 [Deltaproteobacteria bacterium]|nr:hypothetical protein [Deltaproteobacteria bacterium]
MRDALIESLVGLGALWALAVGVLIWGSLITPWLTRRALEGVKVSPGAWAAPGLSLVLLGWVSAALELQQLVEPVAREHDEPAWATRVGLAVVLSHMAALYVLGAVVSGWAAACAAWGARVTQARAQAELLGEGAHRAVVLAVVAMAHQRVIVAGITLLHPEAAAWSLAERISELRALEVAALVALSVSVWAGVWVWRRLEARRD